MPDRIADFLAAAGWAGAARQPLAGDASARRYERLRGADGGHAILMDSPAPAEDVFPFLAIGGLLRDLGLSTPEILAARPEQGLLLLEDFGDGTFSRLLRDGMPAETLYRLGTDVLIALHRRFDPAQAEARDLALPRYDAGLFLEQAMLFVEVYLPAALGRPAETGERAGFEEAWRALLPDACAVPWSLLHRDYHVDNLMHLPDRPGVAACGILDFQSAGLGPVGYDLVSLLEDARRDVPDAIRAEMEGRYLAAFPDLDPARFRRSCAVLSAVRHTRVVAVFARLWLQRGRAEYLVHLPRVWRLLETRLAQPELAPLADWFGRVLPPEARAPLFSAKAR